MSINIKKIVEKIEVEKAAIAVHRDRLRGIYDELESVLSCFDTADEALSHSLMSLTEAIDGFSEEV